MKSNHLYFILLLIAVLIFACIGFKNSSKTLEGFEDAHNAQKQFDKSCINSCKKEAVSLGMSHKEAENKCKKNCDKITKQCHYNAFNSPEWWECLNGINSNIVIPNHIKKQMGGSSIQDNSVDNSYFNQDMENYLDGVSNSSNDSRIHQLEKENKRLKKLQKQFDSEHDQFQKDMKNANKAIQKLSHMKNQGIPRDQIPFGDEDLYILKSEIVPPVCPACPTLNCGNCKTKCPPCPPCARCPEPAFKCEKVPNYKAGKTNPYLPMPWLNDFSQFGNYP